MENQIRQTLDTPKEKNYEKNVKALLLTIFVLSTLCLFASCGNLPKEPTDLCADFWMYQAEIGKNAESRKTYHFS